MTVAEAAAGAAHGKENEVDEPEKPLGRWAARRDARRRPVGCLKAVLLDGRRAAAHVHPNEKRLILRWDGVQWVPQTIADNYAAAQRLLNGIPGDGVMREMFPRPETTTMRNPMAPGTGRHRKP